ncbi:hypothetical protein KI387_017064, partial [Taxus chinensis]
HEGKSFSFLSQSSPLESFYALMWQHVDLIFLMLTGFCSMILHKILMYLYIGLVRTARMGKSGNALVFMLPKEDAYVEFLRIRRIPIQERKYSDAASNIIPQIRSAAMEDRDVMEKGLRAFVSFIRAYKEHHCSYIFRWKELEVGKLAMGYGLLQLPSMTELKRRAFSTDGFVPVEGLDLGAIKYKDKAREKQRQNNIALKQKAKINLEEKIERHKPLGNMDLKGKKCSRQRRAVQTIEDEEEMAQEYRLLKKLKKGIISEREFARATGTEDCLNADDDEDKDGDDELSMAATATGHACEPSSQVALRIPTVTKNSHESSNDLVTRELRRKKISMSSKTNTSAKTGKPEVKSFKNSHLFKHRSGVVKRGQRSKR